MEKVEITETTTIQQPKKQWVKPAMEVMEVDNASSGPPGGDGTNYAS